MAGRRGPAQFGLAGFDADHALARRPRLLRQRGKGRGIVDAFDIQAQGGDTRIIQQGPGQIRQSHHRRIAQTGDIGHRQGALLHPHVDHDVG